MDKGFTDALEGLAAGVQPAPDTGAPRAPAADPALHPSVAALRAKFGEAILHNEVVAGDEHVVFVRPADARETLSWLKEDPEQSYDYLADLTAVDYGGGRPLQVVY